MTTIEEIQAQEAATPITRRTSTQAWDYGDYISIPDIEVVGPRLLVIPPRMKDFKTESGLIIPTQAQEKAARGLIAVVGDGLMFENGKREPSRYTPGMEIVYAKFAGIELEFDGFEYLIINESDVRCILHRHTLHFE